MRQGFSAGCSLEVTLKLRDYENLKPAFWAGYQEEWEEDTISEQEVKDKIRHWQDVCREICEDQVDKDIYDVKQVKVFEQINLRKKEMAKNG